MRAPAVLRLPLSRRRTVRAAHADAPPPPGAANGHGCYFHDLDVWKRAPVLKGTTRFEPRPDVRNIMVTGGAGFM